MLRLLLRDSVIYAVPAFISRGMSLFLIPLYTRVLSPSDYGAFDLLMIFGSLVNLTVSLEVSQGVARFTLDEKDIECKSLYASSALWFTLLCYTIFLLVTLALTPTLSRLIMGVDSLDPIFRLGMFYLWVNGLFYLVQNQLRWELRSKNYAVGSILVSFFTALVTVILAYFLRWGLSGILCGMIVGSTVGFVYALWYLRDRYSFRFQATLLKDMLVFSAPLVPSGIAVFISNYIDRLMINHYLSLDELGLYGIGFRLASVAGLVMVGFDGAITPLIYAHYREEETPRQLAQIFRLFLAFALIFWLGLSLFASNILWVMTTPAYYPAAPVVIYLVPAILLSTMYVFAPGIDIAKKTHLVLLINLGGAMLNTVLSWLLISRFGITGVAVATLLGSVGVFAAYMILSQRFYPVPHNLKPLSLSIIGSVAIAFYSSKIQTHNIAWDMTLKIFMLCLAGWLFITTGLVRKSEIKKALFLAKQKLVKSP